MYVIFRKKTMVLTFVDLICALVSFTKTCQDDYISVYYTQTYLNINKISIYLHKLSQDLCRYAYSSLKCVF